MDVGWVTTESRSVSLQRKPMPMASAISANAVKAVVDAHDGRLCALCDDPSEPNPAHMATAFPEVFQPLGGRCRGPCLSTSGTASVSSKNPIGAIAEVPTSPTFAHVLQRGG